MKKEAIHEYLRYTIYDYENYRETAEKIVDQHLHEFEENESSQEFYRKCFKIKKEILGGLH